MSGCVLLALVSPEKARLRWTGDLGKSLREARAAGRLYLVVGAVACGSAQFEQLTGLPMGTYQLAEVMPKLARLSSSPEFADTVARHNGLIEERDRALADASALGWYWAGGSTVIPVQESRSNGVRVRQSVIRDDDVAAWEMVAQGHGVSILELEPA
jgi:hypothetical protein